jgi:hypothetical protein
VERSELLNRSQCQDGIVIFSRGKVSFASKVLQAQALGAKAVIIAQTEGKWPFLMTDIAKEILSIGSLIPVIMLSTEDADLLLKYAAQCTTAAATSRSRGENKEYITVKIGEKNGDCPICQEGYQIGNLVLKLPCRHTYHADCMTSWLHHNHTCPMCRMQLRSQSTHNNSMQASSPSTEPSFDFVS